MLPGFPVLPTEPLYKGRSPRKAQEGEKKKTKEDIQDSRENSGERLRRPDWDAGSSYHSFLAHGGVSGGTVASPFSLRGSLKASLPGV